MDKNYFYLLHEFTADINFELLSYYYNSPSVFQKSKNFIIQKNEITVIVYRQ